MNIDLRLKTIVVAQPHPLLFATISGAHLYGFPSADSDFDLRGAHVLPLEKVVGLDVRDETIEDSRVIEGLKIDIVSHDGPEVLPACCSKRAVAACVGTAFFASHRPHDSGTRRVEIHCW